MVFAGFVDESIDSYSKSVFIKKKKKISLEIKLSLTKSTKICQGSDNR